MRNILNSTMEQTILLTRMTIQSYHYLRDAGMGHGFYIFCHFVLICRSQQRPPTHWLLLFILTVVWNELQLNELPSFVMSGVDVDGQTPPLGVLYRLFNLLPHC